MEPNFNLRTETVTDKNKRGSLHLKGRNMWARGMPEPFPNAEYQSEGYYINCGWHSVPNQIRKEREEQERQAIIDAGLDDESLNKLRGQLEALGFTVPN